MSVHFLDCYENAELYQQTPCERNTLSVIKLKFSEQNFITVFKKCIA